MILVRVLRSDAKCLDLAKGHTMSEIALTGWWAKCEGLESKSG